MIMRTEKGYDYTVEDPDFNFQEFRSNLVAKWEYRLGSFIYLVWSSEKSALTGAVRCFTWRII